MIVKILDWMLNNNGYALAKRIDEDTIEIIETFTELKDLKKYEERAKKDNLVIISSVERKGNNIGYFRN